jgi:hypothetical protein
MRISRGLRALAIIAVLFPSLALGNHFDKTVPLPPNKLSGYTGEQIFESAYQAYVCSFLMTLADQIEKGQFLRFYSVKLMQEKRVRDLGKNWNDVNFPGALSAMTLIGQFQKRFNIPEPAAATRLLNEDPQCKTLNEFSEVVLKKRKK